jgi:hypothetical protein
VSGIPNDGFGIVCPQDHAMSFFKKKCVSGHGLLFFPPTYGIFNIMMNHDEPMDLV